MTMPIVSTKREACEGTGLYSGFKEPKGVAVVCRECNGTGCKTLEYTYFVARRQAHGIHTVRTQGKDVPYNDFLQGKL